MKQPPKFNIAAIMKHPPKFNLDTTLRILGLLVGILLAILQSLNSSANLYTNWLKKSFNYTQGEVELISSLQTLGGMASLPAAFMYKTLSVRATITFGCMLTVGSYLALYMSTRYVLTFIHLSGIIAVLHFTAAHGAGYLFISSVLVNISNFSGHNRGKVLVLVEGTIAVGASLFATVYSSFFVQDHIYDAVNQRADLFFLTLIAYCCVVWVLGMIFLQTYPNKDSETGYEKLTDSKSQEMDSISQADTVKCGERDLNSKNKYTVESETNHSTTAVLKRNTESRLEKSHLSHDNEDHEKKMVENENLIQKEIPWYKTLNVYIALWGFTVMTSLHRLFLVNTTTILHSIHHDKEIPFYTTIPIIIAFTGNLIVCSVADWLHTKFQIRTSNILLAAALTILTSNFVFIFFITNYIVLVIFGIITITAGEISFTLTPAMLSQNLKMSDLGPIIGIFYTAGGLMSFLVCKVFGMIYDSQVELATHNDCYGSHCFIWSFVLSTCLAFTQVVSLIVLIIKKW